MNEFPRNPADLTKSTSLPGTLEVCSLGLVEFDSAWALQERLIYDLGGRNDRQGHLLLCEHPPVITMGREASRREILLTDEQLAQRDLAVTWVSRGGGPVVHVPGQLAIYLLLPLARLGLTVSDYRSRFEAALICVCREFGVPVKRVSEPIGLLSRGGQIAVWGAAVRNGVSCFGMWLNVHPWPGFHSLTHSHPRKLFPPDPQDISIPQDADRDRGRGGSTSLQALIRRPMDMGSIREAVSRHVANQFDYDTMNYSTGHPLLQRTRRRVCTHA